MYKHEGVMAFGCNCGKSKMAQVPGASGPVSRSTVYQVILDGSTVDSEFGTLPEARRKATEVGGRVKISTKIG